MKGKEAKTPAKPGQHLT
jgi:rare lipoprotein A (peptidoglycan hydrolase)